MAPWPALSPDNCWLRQERFVLVFYFPKRSSAWLIALFPFHVHPTGNSGRRYRFVLKGCDTLEHNQE